MSRWKETQWTPWTPFHCLHLDNARVQGSTYVALTMGSESNNSLSNSKEVQTYFDLSKQKDERILLLVYCPNISSTFVCSELRVKNRKKFGQEVTREQQETCWSQVSIALHLGKVDLTNDNAQCKAAERIKPVIFLVWTSTRTWLPRLCLLKMHVSQQECLFLWQRGESVQNTAERHSCAC